MELVLKTVFDPPKSFDLGRFCPTNFTPIFLPILAPSGSGSHFGNRIRLFVSNSNDMYGIWCLDFKTLGIVWDLVSGLQNPRNRQGFGARDQNPRNRKGFGLGEVRN